MKSLHKQSRMNLLRTTAALAVALALGGGAGIAGHQADHRLVAMKSPYGAADTMTRPAVRPFAGPAYGVHEAIRSEE
jgi:uncharacterized membrane protein